MNSILTSPLTTTFLALIATAFGYIIKRQHTKIREIQSLLYEKKYSLYTKIYSILFDLVKAQKSKRKLSEEALGKRIIDIKKDLLIYAPDHIVLKFIKWHESNFQEDHMKNAKTLFELYSLIRKDMGYPKSKINELEVLRIIMGNPVEVEKMRQEIDI